MNKEYISEVFRPDILNVSVGKYSDTKDDYGSEIVPPLPLSFDRVNEGRPNRSKAPFLNLPTEILGVILQWTAPESLASLALVNHDCLQLARSRQFSSIQLNYSDSSLGLLGKFLEEGRQRSASPSAMTSPYLGACVRRITVATHPGWVSHRHGSFFADDEFAALPREEQTKLMQKATTAFFDGYILSIQAVLNSMVLPHLELLNWEDKISLPPSFFETLALSPIKHLKLSRVAVDYQFSIAMKEPFSTCKWPLRTLHLDLNPRIDLIKEISISALGESILRLCSPTLEELTLQTIDRSDAYAFTDATIGTIPKFPNIRRLNIGSVRLEDSSILEALVQDSLRFLEVGWAWDPIYVDYFKRRGTITSLETLVWNRCHLIGEVEVPYEFLLKNPHIATLAIPQPLPSTVLETEIIPLLVNYFTRLTSLNLVWKDISIPDSALHEIGSLKTLKQIHLSANTHTGWKHDWIINHDSLRRHLRNLPLLTKMAFSLDSYEPMRESYYQQPQNFGMTRMETCEWERGHRQRMLDEANKYIDVMPKLQWMYFGQIPMGVKSEQPGSKIVRPLFKERDDCYTLLKRMFGGTPG